MDVAEIRGETKKRDDIEAKSTGVPLLGHGSAH
jgi:hypothetical protein